MTDDQILANLFRRLLGESYWDTILWDESTQTWIDRRRLCVDGSLYDLTDAEFDALDRIVVTA